MGHDRVKLTVTDADADLVIRPAVSRQEAQVAYELPAGVIAPSHPELSSSLIGEVIVELGFARADAVESAVAASRAQGRTTGQVLLEAGEIRPEQLARALAERTGVLYVDLDRFAVEPRALELVDADLVRRHQAAPVGFLADGSVLLAMADPTNLVVQDELAMTSGLRMRAAAAVPAAIAALLPAAEPATPVIEALPAHVGEVFAGRTGGADVHATLAVEELVTRAVQLGASDVHCEPGPRDTVVRFRIDGVLVEQGPIPRQLAADVVARIKTVSGMDPAETGVPQDGRMVAVIDGRRVEIRAVALPLVGGEGIVLRILDPLTVVRNLRALGMRERERARFAAAIERPSGAVLVAAPVGSGKSATLYSALTLLNDGTRSILTIEDPVETQLDGVHQMQVATRAGVSFATGLRAILRADPEVVLVGELDSAETALMSVQAALAGHLVLAGVHTSDAAGALVRLIEFGIEPFMVASAVTTVVGQRLARTLCPHCKRPATISPSVRRRHELTAGEIYEPVGCVRCGETGFAGRIGLFEALPVTDEIRGLLIDRRDGAAIAAAAARGGMRTMHADGLEKVRDGVTSLAEVLRVTSAR